METFINCNDIILFQGDSVTDCARLNTYSQLGEGYAFILASHLMQKHPDKNLTIINKGISGNRVCDLVERWVEDCLDIKPNILSILIGINDVWRKYDSSDPTTKEKFENGYRQILKSYKDIKPNGKIIILEPFVLPYPEDRLLWREDLDPKIQVARKLAREFNALYVPLDGIFAGKSIYTDPSHWAEDGVHPTLAGHALIAKEWINAIGE